MDIYADSPILPERLRYTSGAACNVAGKWVIYRMQASVRTEQNLALSEACRISRLLDKPLKIVFHLNAAFPEANYRHFLFLAQGLSEVAAWCYQQSIPFEYLTGDFKTALEALLPDTSCLISDRGYLRVQREQSDWLRTRFGDSFIEVEDNLIVPVESASSKREWAARTLRPKLEAKMPYFTDSSSRSIAIPPITTAVGPDTAEKQRQILSLFLEEVRHRNYLSPVDRRGGQAVARQLLETFATRKLDGYAHDRNYPELAATSCLSAYLHFGMISPLTICWRLQTLAGAAPFIEQLLVRRELAHNYIYYTPAYSDYEALPAWARDTLGEHQSDRRPHLYTLAQLENAQTEDACWNAAMREMVATGYMENTMRMYWGKKIIEWSETAPLAFRNMLYLNNRYFLDGRDANSYAGVGWCFGLHDRPWQSRPVFGTVRYMNEAGLRRKYDMARYIDRF